MLYETLSHVFFTNPWHLLVFHDLRCGNGDWWSDAVRLQSQFHPCVRAKTQLFRGNVNPYLPTSNFYQPNLQRLKYMYMYSVISTKYVHVHILQHAAYYKILSCKLQCIYMYMLLCFFVCLACVLSDSYGQLVIHYSILIKWYPKWNSIHVQ